MKSKLNRAILISAAAATALTFAPGCASCRKGGGTASYGAAPVVYNEPEAAPAPQGAPPAMVGTSEQATGNEIVVPLQKEQANVATERVDQGAIRVRKEVQTQTVNLPVTVRNETVTMERVPAGNAAPAGGQTSLNAPFQGGEITIPLVKEQPVVTKEVVPNGAVVIHKQGSTQQMNLTTQVRTEQAFAEPTGNTQGVTIPQNLQGQGAPPAGYGQAGGEGGTITSWDQLSGSPESCVGKQVNISNAKIDHVISPNLVTVQGDSGKTFYVHLSQPATLQPGQTVTLTGTVQQVPSDTQTLGWDPQSTQAIQGQQIIISSPSLTAQPQQ